MSAIVGARSVRVRKWKAEWQKPEQKGIPLAFKEIDDDNNQHVSVRHIFLRSRGGLRNAEDDRRGVAGKRDIIGENGEEKEKHRWHNIVRTRNKCEAYAIYETTLRRVQRESYVAYTNVTYIRYILYGL